MRVLCQSKSHAQHWHVGLQFESEVVMTCHIHYKDIEEDWNLIHNNNQ